METVKVDIQKLQLLNDRIAQTIEALNHVRMSVQVNQQASAPTGFVPSYGYGGYGTPFVGQPSFVGQPTFAGQPGYSSLPAFSAQPSFAGQPAFHPAFSQYTPYAVNPFTQPQYAGIQHTTPMQSTGWTPPQTGWTTPQTGWTTPQTGWATPWTNGISHTTMTTPNMWTTPTWLRTTW